MLRTERLRLDPFRDEDLASLHALWTDPDMRRYLWDDEVISVERARRAVEESHRSFAELGLGQFCLRRPAARALVGFAGFRRFEGDEAPELLYGIDRRAWGEGLATEASRALLAEGFRRHGFRRVVAATDTPNQSSVHVLQRLGMVFVERRLHHGLDTVFYELTADAWARAGSPIPR